MYKYMDVYVCVSMHVCMYKPQTMALPAYLQVVTLYACRCACPYVYPYVGPYVNLASCSLPGVSLHVYMYLRM